jgi:hypothetical protein
MELERELRTLRDAVNFIAKLLKREHDAPERQAAIRAPMLVVEHDGQTLLARICMMRALYPPGKPAPRKTRKKRAKNIIVSSDDLLLRELIAADSRSRCRQAPQS